MTRATHRSVSSALLLAVAAMLVSSCGPRLSGRLAVEPEPDESVDGRAAASPPATSSAPVLTLPTSADGDRPSWFQEPEPIWYTPEFSAWERSLVGTDTGILPLQSDAMILLDRSEGALGIVGGLGFSWYSVFADDSVIGSSYGQLMRAESAEAAVAGEWTELRAFPDVVAWDVAGDYFVVAEPWAVHLSTDRGDSFVKHEPLQGVSIFNTEVRSDGTVAVIARDGAGNSKVALTPDFGATWLDSAFQPQALNRVGARLQWTDPNGCTWAVAQNAAKGWVSDDAWTDPYSWNRMAVTGNQPVWLSEDRLARSDEPAAPAWSAEAAVSGPQPECTWRQMPSRDRSASVSNELEMLTPWRVAPEDCEQSGLACIVEFGSPKPIPGKLAYEFLGDGVCTPESGSVCTRPSRLPHVLEFDVASQATRVVDLPAECTLPLEVVGARGLGALLCAVDDRRDLWTRDPDDAVWERVASIDASGPVAMVQSSDGWFGLHTLCADGESICALTVGRPGDAEFRAVDIEGAAAYHLAAGGRVIQLRQTDEGHALTLVEREPTLWGETFTLAPTVDASMPLHAIDVDEDGRVRLTSLSNAMERRHYLRTDGSLVSESDF